MERPATVAQDASPQGLYGAMVRALGPLIRAYSRVEVRGREHLPAGRTLIVSNHPGSLWWDAFCMAAAFDNRQIRFVAQEWDSKVPGMAQFLRTVGSYFQQKSLAAIDRRDPIVKGLQKEQLLTAFPEQSYHTFRSRQTLYRFAPHAAKYAHLADAPLVPCAVIGAEFAAATLAGWKARGMPFHFPWLPPVLLPLKIIIEIGAPSTFEELLAEDRESVTSPCAYQHAADRLQRRVAGLIEKHRPCEISGEFYLDQSAWW